MKWRCTDCFGMPTFCTSCCRSFHLRAPFHRIEEWNGQTFYPSAMRKTGLVLHMEHASMPCPGMVVESPSLTGQALPVTPDTAKVTSESVSNPKSGHDILDPFDLSMISAALDSPTDSHTDNVPSTSEDDTIPTQTQSNQPSPYVSYFFYNAFSYIFPAIIQIMLVMMMTLTKWNLILLVFRIHSSSYRKDMTFTIMSG